MNTLHLRYEYSQLMKQAQEVESRKEALAIIHKATKLMETADFLKANSGLTGTTSTGVVTR